MTLPGGYRVRLAPGLLESPDGRVLVGGSPVTAIGLTEPARELLRGGTVTVRDVSSAHLADRLLHNNLGVPDLSGCPEVSADDLTVVIPVRDRPVQLERALKALHPLDCLVVDDGSIAPDLVAVVAHRHEARLLSLATNMGPAAARNAGLEQVRTRYVAFVDSDVEVSPGALLRLTRHFADTALVLTGPRVIGVARSALPSWFERYDAAASSLTLGRTPGLVRPGAAVAWLPSACVVARTEALMTDGFDESLRVGEDVDLVWRLTDAGHRVRYDPTITALHDVRPTLAAWLGRKFVYGTGGASLAARHGNRLAPAVLTPAYAAAAAALLLRRWWAVPIVLGAWSSGSRSVRSALPDSVGRNTIAMRLAARGLVWALRQESALMLRHWWPAAAAGAIAFPAVRRALVTALVVDAAVATGERRAESIPINPVVVACARRLDDLAYGAGLWWGALRARSLRALLPRTPH
jgi:mycofactocin system glycosyltransferase